MDITLDFRDWALNTGKEWGGGGGGARKVLNRGEGGADEVLAMLEG